MARLVPLAALCALFAACGGGGSSAPPADSVAPTASSEPATCGLADFRAAAMARMNRWRASGADCGSEGRFGPAPTLAWSDTLARAAGGHSQDMAAHDFFSHTGSDGRTAAQRISAAGYAWSSIGENIAAGQQRIDEVVDGWIASPPHCANLLDPGFTRVGLACVRATAASTYPTYWTMDLARPR